MNTIKSALVGAGLICFLIVLPETASAHSRFHISFGTGFVHDHLGFYISCYPRYGWHGGHYRRLGRYGHRRLHVPSWRHSYWRRSWCAPGVGVWIDDWWPSMIVEGPVIVETPRVITKKEVIIKPKYDDKTLKLYNRLRTKKSELLKKLKLGDKEERKKAIEELAGFSFDDKVRTALEDILLSDPDPELRKEAAKSFAKVRNHKALQALEKARVEDSDKEVRKEADKSIKKIKRFSL